MTDALKPFMLHGHLGPNSWKVALVLESLSLPYEHKIYETGDLKIAPFVTQLNKNGYTPVLEDPNNAFKIWESNACMEYLVMVYDAKSPVLSFDSTNVKERALMAQYMSFQSSFQGPAMTNAFSMKMRGMDAAAEYFAEQTIRLLGVLEGELEDKTWLVGDKCTIADLGSLPFTWSIPFLLSDKSPDMTKDYPCVDAWTKRMMNRPSSQKVYADRMKLVKSTMSETK